MGLFYLKGDTHVENCNVREWYSDEGGYKYACDVLCLVALSFAVYQTMLTFDFSHDIDNTDSALLYFIR